MEFVVFYSDTNDAACGKNAIKWGIRILAAIVIGIDFQWMPTVGKPNSNSCILSLTITSQQTHGRKNPWTMCCANYLYTRVCCSGEQYHPVITQNTHNVTPNTPTSSHEGRYIGCVLTNLIHGLPSPFLCYMWHFDAMDRVITKLNSAFCPVNQNKQHIASGHLAVR